MEATRKDAFPEDLQVSKNQTDRVADSHGPRHGKDGWRAEWCNPVHENRSASCSSALTLDLIDTLDGISAWYGQTFPLSLTRVNCL